MTELGFMLDISRDRVPTMATIEWLIDVLADLGYDQLQLYTEHTFAYEGHDTVWRDASPITPDELRAIDARAGERGLELVPNVNVFAHMERWLKHPEYRGRGECPDGFADPLRGGRHRDPTCLAPTADNAEFGVALARELAGHTSSRRIHIGGDEPWELGLGVSRPNAEQRGRTRVYLDHLRRLIEPLAGEGREVWFWGDVLRRHPELLAELPGGCVPVVWNYEAPSPDAGVLAQLGSEVLEHLGLPEDAHLGFVSHARNFVGLDLPVWLAPGTSSWNTLLGRWTNARENIDDAVAFGASMDAAGLLLTDWGDNGHLQPLVISLLPIAHLAIAAGRVRGSAEDIVDGIVGVPGAGARLATLGDLYRRTGLQSMNASPLFGGIAPKRAFIFGEPDPDGIAAVIDDLNDALAWVTATPFPDNGHRLGLDAAIRLARLGAMKLADRAGLEVGISLDERAAELDHAIEVQTAAWRATSREGGLQDSLAVLQR